MKLTEKSYIAVDLCYIYPENEWGDFCEILEKEDFFDDRKGEKVTDKFGNTFYFFRTAYGDGIYPMTKHGNFVSELGVDSGTLSIVPLEIAQTWPDFEENKKSGFIFSLDEECEVHYNKGDCKFGPYEILTESWDYEMEDLE